ncbi:hypothetical protein GKE82_23435 [Conexibacter sp. W3-3-2]|uniref:DUF5983 family protein n=1 Tax=Conexibacter sp. W3-3-2 TaxID=2675227 RepID=UPI0012B93736|nr:hypothetical protein [Conexibacter sp. W3-3-2]MTD47158.1 hypothetical protein [Conexibacter sp. W3-3-2]
MTQTHTIRTVLDLSTGHLTEQTRTLLRRAQSRQGFGLRTVPHQHGAIAFLSEDLAQDLEHVPVDLARTVTLAHQHSALLINFDADAPTHPDLPVHD